MEEPQNKKSGFPETCSAPWLTFFHGKSKKMSQTFYSISERQFYVTCIPEMRNSICWETVLGWILILDLPSKQWFLLNPKTRAKIELPQLDLDLHSRCQFLLSLPPTDPDSVIMCADFSNKFLYFCRPGAEKWITHGYNLGEDSLSYVVACNGRFYGLTSRMNFSIIDFAPRLDIRILATELDFKVPMRLNYEAFRVHLVESLGQIFMVQSYFLGFDEKLIYLLVHQMNFSTNSWDMVDNIGDDRVFFLGHPGFAASWSASELGVKRNCIYLTMSNDVRMYVFDMEEGTLAAHLPCPNVRKPCSESLWIVPTP